MRALIPFEFDQLGPVEFLWLVLAGAGISLLLPARRRTGAALVTGGLFAVFALLRAITLEGTAGAWQRWWGPGVVVPLLAAGCVLLGDPRLRPGRRTTLAGLGALVLVSLVGAPFGLTLPGHLAEWAAVVLGGFAFAALAHGEGAAARLWRRPLAEALTVGRATGVALLVLGGFARPFGLGWVGVLAVLFAGWVIAQVIAQGRGMQGYVLRRLRGAPVVLFVLLLVSFVLIRKAPGGPFDKEKQVDPVIQELMEAKFALDRPLHVQFRKFMVELIWDGDLGPSMKFKDRTVNEIIAVAAPASARLALAALALALLFGVSAGLVSGMFRNSIFDYSSMAFAMLGLALPTFIVGPMLVLLFAMRLDWFPVTGWGTPLELVLPAVTLALPFTARIARLTRAGMLEVVHQDYIRTARAKGLSTPVIVVRHTLKGTLLPVVSFLGPGIAMMLTGSLVVEKIFGVPGMGREFVEAALNRDYTLAMGLVLVFGTLLITFNLVVDVVYAFLDPRIRHG